jgi:hypothetical protein
LGSVNGDVALKAPGEFVGEVDVETLIAATRKIWKGMRRERGIDPGGGNSSALAGTTRNKTAATAENRCRVIAFPSTEPTISAL